MNLQLSPELCIVWHMYDIMHAAQKPKARLKFVTLDIEKE